MFVLWRLGVELIVSQLRASNCWHFSLASLVFVADQRELPAQLKPSERSGIADFGMRWCAIQATGGNGRPLWPLAALNKQEILSN